MTTGYKKMLCPTDFSSFSEMAMKKCIELAKQFNAEMVVAHVVTNPWSDAYKEKETDDVKLLYSSPTEVREAVTAKLEKLLGEVADGISTQVVVVSKEHTYKGIIEIAEENGVDLIVMATQGRTGAKRFFTGSVTENVVRKASCSVLVVRE